MKRSFLLLVLGLCIALTATCGPSPETMATQTATVATAIAAAWTETPTSSSPQTADTPSPTAAHSDSPYRHYEPTGGFSYMPPAGWHVVESSGLEYKVAVGPVEDEFAANINVVDEAFSGSLEEYVAASLDNMRQFFQGFRLLSQDEFKPQEGRSGVRIVTENVQNGRKLWQIFYFFDAGATKLVVACTRLADTGEELDATFEESVKTFRFESE